MKTKVEQFSANNPNPILSVANDGTVLYSNQAGEPLLHEWGVKVGGKLPSYVEDFVQKVISLNSPEKMEVNVGKRVYLIAFHPLLEEECVNIYGFEISDQKELERKLRFHANLVDNVSDAIISTDKELKIRSWNKAAERMYGWQENEVIGLKGSDVLQTTFPEGLSREAIAKDIFEKGGWEGELIQRTKDGRDITVYAKSMALRDEAGVVIGGVSISPDITDRKRADEALRKNREDFDRAQAVGNIGSWRLDVRKNELTWSDENHRIFGIPKGVPLTYETFLSTVHQDDREYVDKEWKAGLAGKPYDIEHRIITDGKIKWVREKAYLEFDKAGTLLGGFGITQDITERKRVENSLRESEERYRTLFNTMDEGFCIIEMLFDENEKPIDYIFTETNPAFERQTGFKNAVGKRIRELAPANEEYWCEIYGKVALTAESVRFENRVEELHRWYEVYAYRIGQPESRKVAILFNDITQRKRMEETLLAKDVELQLIADTTPILLTRLSRDLHYVFVNRACAEMFGRTREEIVGKPIVEIMGKEAFETIRPYVEKVLQGQRVEYETEIPYQGVGTRFMHVEYTPERNVQDEVVGWLASISDITERKQLEEQTRRRAEELEMVMEVAPVAIWIGHDPQSHDITGNRMANEFYEAEPGENVSANVTPVRRFFYKGRELTADELPMQQASLNNIDIRNAEFEVLLPSGERRALMGSASPLQDAKGHVRGSVGTFVDITERKRAEAIREAINSINQVIHSTLDFDEIIQKTVLEATRIVGSDSAAISLRKGDRWIVRYVYGFPDDVIGAEMNDDEALHAVLAVKTRKPVVINDVLNDERVNRNHMKKWGIRSVLVVPLITKDEVIGVIFFNCHKSIFAFDNIHVDFATRLGSSISLALENSLLFEKLKTELAERKKAGNELREAYEKIQKQSEELQVFNEELQVQSEELHEANEALHESEKRFRTLTENSPDVITRFDRENRYMYANPAASKAYGFSQEEIIGKTQGELGMNPELVKFLETYQEIVFTIGKPETIEFQYKSPQGKEHYFSTKIVPEFANGKVSSVLAISRDIKDLKETEAKLKDTLDNLEELVKERTVELEKAYISLKEGERGLAEAQRMAHLGNWVHNIKTGEIYWSDEVYRIFGFKPQESVITYNIFLSYVHTDDRDFVVNAVRRALNGEFLDIEHRIVLADGVERIVHEEGKVAFDKKNTPIRMIGTIQDITERKQVEKALRDSETRLRRFYESGIIGALYFRMDGLITEANDKFLEMVGYTREDLQAGRIKWDKMTPPEYRPLEDYAIAELKATGVATPYTKEYIRKDGSRIPIILGAATTNEARNEGIAFILDITERKKAEEYLAKIEIARKQEIHHRIKNNLQVISSLLDLQAEQFRDKECIKDSEVLQAFRESQDRVISMALIHEELYKGGGFDTIDFSPYIRELAENLFKTYSLGNIDISLNTDLEENLFFDMDTAVPLGIIVNELVSNSLKHAFIGRDKGEIRIKFDREEFTEFKTEDCESTSFTLTVSDNGVGIPENFDLEDLDSLGFQLVTSLVDQLDGEFELKRNNGTEFIIRFTVIKKLIRNQHQPRNN